MHHGPEIRRLGIRSVRQRGGHDPRLKPQRAQGVELVAGQRDDPHRIGPHRRLTGGVFDRPWRRSVERRGFRSAGFIRPTLIPQHAGRGDLRGAGDHAAGRWVVRGLPRRRTAAEDQGRGDHDGQAGKRGAEQHDATVTPVPTNMT